MVSGTCMASSRLLHKSIWFECKNKKYLEFKPDTVGQDTVPLALGLCVTSLDRMWIRCTQPV